VHILPAARPTWSRPFWTASRWREWRQAAPATLHRSRHRTQVAACLTIWSGKKFWWRGRCGHERRSSIAYRALWAVTYEFKTSVTCSASATSHSSTNRAKCGAGGGVQKRTLYMGAESPPQRDHSNQLARYAFVIVCLGHRQLHRNGHNRPQRPHPAATPSVRRPSNEATYPATRRLSMSQRGEDSSVIGGYTGL
jgi:hypothetical protein